jgi:hypothetical protein
MFSIVLDFYGSIAKNNFPHHCISSPVTEEKMYIKCLLILLIKPNDRKEYEDSMMEKSIFYKIDRPKPKTKIEKASDNKKKDENKDEESEKSKSGDDKDDEEGDNKSSSIHQSNNKKRKTGGDNDNIGGSFMECKIDPHDEYLNLKQEEEEELQAEQFRELNAWYSRFIGNSPYLCERELRFQEEKNHSYSVIDKFLYH